LSDSEDYWKERVVNPKAFGDKEKELWKQIEPILFELLDEVKANGKIKTAFFPDEMKHIGSIVDNYNQTSLNHNLLLHLADSLEKSQRFLEATSEFGFDESKSVSLFVEVGVLLVILSTELFKVFLLFHLKDVDHAVSRFSITMGEVAPKTWKKLKPYVDSPFRNSLAHGTWTIENKKIILFRDANFNPLEELNLAEFMMRAKTQNVQYSCLKYVIDKNMMAGFFK
jgi:hypothetical protein